MAAFGLQGGQGCLLTHDEVSYLMHEFEFVTRSNAGGAVSILIKAKGDA
jgi:hypothetical protein